MSSLTTEEITGLNLMMSARNDLRTVIETKGYVRDLRILKTLLDAVARINACIVEIESVDASR